MRGLFQFAIFLAIVFFIVGEFFGGWYLGVAPQTPIFVYKNNHITTIKRQSFSAGEVPFTVKGKLRRGVLTVEGIYERPTSIQHTTRTALPPKIYFSESFRANEPIFLSETIKQGPGIYRLKLIFEDASGTVNVDIPPSSSL